MLFGASLCFCDNEEYFNLAICFCFQLYRFLVRRTNSKFNKIILKRLCMTRVNRPPVSLSKIANLMSHPGRAERIAVIVGTVVDDPRLYTVPKFTVSLDPNFVCPMLCLILTFVIHIADLRASCLVESTCSDFKSWWHHFDFWPAGSESSQRKENSPYARYVLFKSFKISEWYSTVVSIEPKYDTWNIVLFIFK